MVLEEININLKTQVIDESYSQGMVTAPLLLLLFDKNKISYTIIDKQRQKAVLLKEYALINDLKKEENIDYHPGFFTQLLDSDEILRDLTPSQVILAIYSSKHSLVPDPLYAKEEIKEILSLTSSINSDDRCYADPVRAANAHLLFAVPEVLLKETGSVYKEASLFFAGSSFIESQLRLYKHESKAKVSLMVRSQCIDILVTQGKDLKFYNSFNYQTSEDLIYYLLFSMEQLQLNPDQTEVFCFGEIEKISSHWLLASKYIRNLQFGERSDVLNYSYGFDRLSPHQYVGLFNQYLCAS